MPLLEPLLPVAPKSANNSRSLTASVPFIPPSTSRIIRSPMLLLTFIQSEDHFTIQVVYCICADQPVQMCHHEACYNNQQESFYNFEEGHHIYSKGDYHVEEGHDSSEAGHDQQENNFDKH